MSHPAHPHTPELAIEAHGIVRVYRQGSQEVRALDALDLAVAAGSVFGLLGPNGAGKSTTVRVLTTLATADSGSMTVAGFDVAQQPRRVRAAIGYVPQQSCFNPTATGREDLRAHGRLQGLPAREAAARADELLNIFGLADAGNRITKTWSGGMQRKLDVALGLIHQPEVLFLDEPTTGLDPEARADMWAEIKRLAQGGLTTLLTTHYLDEADQLADNIAIVDRGRVVATGEPAELKAGLARDSIQVGLDKPDDATQARQTLQSLVPGATLSQDSETTLNIQAPDGAVAMPRVLTALTDAAIDLESLSLARPTLDDVYLHYAGRSFAHANETAKKEVV